MVTGRIDGTHQGNKSNVPNTAEPRKRSKLTKREERLKARLKAFEEMKISGDGFNRPGSLSK